MCLFDLDMSSIKSEALAQEYSKRQLFLKILQDSLENNPVLESLLRSYFTQHRCFPVKFAQFLRTPFTNNYIEHLQHLYLQRFFYGSKVHSLLITFSKVSMKLKEHIKCKSVRYMCHADTCASNEIRDFFLFFPRL